MINKQLKEAAKLIGSQGGKATLKKYGKEHFKEIRKRVGLNKKSIKKCQGDSKKAIK